MGDSERDTVGDSAGDSARFTGGKFWSLKSMAGEEDEESLPIFGGGGMDGIAGSGDIIVGNKDGQENGEEERPEGSGHDLSGFAA
jgi:hypothetical protein